MYSSRRSGPVTDLHNAHTVSTLMRTMTTNSGLNANHSGRNSSRTRTSFNGTLPFRSSSIHQVESRDREIERAHRALDSSRSADLLALEMKLRSNEKLIANQNAQIDFLQDKNRSLEQRLEELTELKRDLSNKQFEERIKNDDLLRDLQDIDRLARKVQADKEFTVEAADRELNEAKLEIEQNHREIQSLDNKVAGLSLERKSLIDEIELLKSQLIERNNENSRLEEIIDQIRSEKSKLTRRVSRLVQNEKELLQELQRCRRTTKAPTPTAAGGNNSKKLTLSARVETHLKNLEDERDMYKNQLELLQRIQNNRSRSPSPFVSNSSRNRARSSSANGAQRNSSRRETATSPIRQLIKNSNNSRSQSPTRCTVCGIHRGRMSPTKDPSGYDISIRSVDETRRDRQRSKRHSRERDIDENQLDKVLREKEDLQNLLSKFERHMAEIQGNIKVLTNERDNLSLLYEQTREELQRTRHELLQNAQTPKVSLTAQTILRKVENERDNAIIEARSMTNERDSLRERLKIATDTNLKERARFEQTIEDLENEIRKIDRDREEMITEKHLLIEQIKQLETQLREQSFTISQFNQELNEQKNASAKLRFLSEEAESLVQENQRQLNFKQEELRSQDEKMLRLEKRIHDLQEANQAIKDDFHRSRATIQTLDAEKDRLNHEIDLRAEENLHLNQELNTKNRQIEEFHLHVTELETTLDRSNEEIKMKIKEITQLRMQLDRNAEELNEYRRQLDLITRDNKRLQEDLLNGKRENQDIRQELQRTIEDKENNRVQVQEYIKQVSKCENDIAQKENERTILIEQFRETSNELNRAKLTLAQMESEVKSLRGEIQSRDSEMKRLLDRAQFHEKELEKQISLSQEYEIQLSNLTRSMQRNDDLIKKLQADKMNIGNEVGNLRDLNSAIEVEKEQLMRQLSNREIENERIQSSYGDLKIQIDLLRNQLNNEQSMNQNLSEIINSLREKEFQRDIHSQERDSDLQLARDRVTLSDLKIQNQNKEIAALRTSVVNLESENKRLKSLLTSERYERSNIHRSPARSYSPTNPETSPTRGVDRSHNFCLDTTQ